MKRSQINAIIRENEAFIAKHCFMLPPFTAWTPEEWKTKGPECDEIRDNMLGWDVTDFGLGDYDTYGLFLVTIRNGNQNNPKYTKPYAEKLMIVNEGQTCPMHFHWFKQEDIINRGGGVLCMKVYNATADEELDETGDVVVVCDGVKKVVPAGTVLELQPGESCTVTQRMYHSFWAKPGCGKCLCGEVSQCNDDSADNRFHQPVGRFPAIEEDEAPYRLLCNEYPKA
ncbi:MAG: D-lyxose/D-mannose family sugar isomerase [Clostridia bacterium]|nr:D-lyxose/D-mannose family sugar isomerase [Clostridia bacterium]